MKGWLNVLIILQTGEVHAFQQRGMSLPSLWAAWQTAAERLSKRGSPSGLALDLLKTPRVQWLFSVANNNPEEKRQKTTRWCIIICKSNVLTYNHLKGLVCIVRVCFWARACEIWIYLQALRKSQKCDSVMIAAHLCILCVLSPRPLGTIPLRSWGLITQ